MNQQLFQIACLQFIGLPYRWGGDDPINGFDCSGLAQELLAMIGLDPVGDQSAQVLHDYFVKTGVEGARDTGTLCFYGKSKTQITHVGVLLDDLVMIEAGGGGSKTLTLNDAAQQNAYIRLRPFTHRTDLVAIVKPAGLPW